MVRFVIKCMHKYKINEWSKYSLGDHVISSHVIKRNEGSISYFIEEREKLFLDKR